MDSQLIQNIYAKAAAKQAKVALPEGGFKR